MRAIHVALTMMLTVSAVGQRWQHEFELDRPPRGLAPGSDAGGELTVSAPDSVLRVRSPEFQSSAYLGIGTTAPNEHVTRDTWGKARWWDGNRPTTVEVRLRVVERLDLAPVATMIQVSGGYLLWQLGIGIDGIYNGQKRILELAATEFHTYRLSFRDGGCNAFVDGERIPDECVAQSSHPRNALLIGDFSSAVAGLSEIDTIRWTNREATPFEMPERVSNVDVNPPFELTSPDVRYPFATTGGSVVLPDGRVLLTYSGPVSPHGQPPGTCWIYGRYSKDGGRTWGRERKLINHPECQACAPGVLLQRSGVLRMIYMGFYRARWEDGEPIYPDHRSDLWAALSRDGGKTWVRRECIWEGYTGATNSLIELSSGEIVVPFSYYVNSPGRIVSAVVMSADGGKSWQLGDHIDMGGAGDHSGAIEPCVVELRDGRVLMFLRTQKGSFYQALSNDAGLTWTEPEPTALGAPNSPCHVRRLSDGRIAVAWNNTMETTKGRDSLHLAFSDDDAQTWSEPMLIGKSEQLSYPSITEISPGRLMITGNHVRGGWSHVTPEVFTIDLP